MRKNNKGMSYVELLLVLAIMAILIGVVSISVGLIARTNVNRGAEQVASTFNQARSTSMARGNTNGRMEITCSNGRYYYYVGNTGAADKEEQKVEFLASPGIVTYGATSDSGAQTQITATNPLVITFNQSSGAVSSCTNGEGNVVSANFITLTNGDDSAVIRIYTATGKCELLY